MGKRKYILLVVVFLLGLIPCVMWVSNAIVVRSTQAFHSGEVEKVPATNVCLVLGTSKELKNGRINLYFSKRIQACVKLWKARKVKAFIVSGDNRKPSYNEAFDMRIALIREGIPDSVIHPDYAGLRTLDSVVRSKEVFGQDSIVIVSQEFHNQRALYIAKHRGVVAYGFDAEDVNTKYGFKTRIREYFARVKVLIDIHLTGKKPRHLGPTIQI
jgi:SanA protein